MDHQGPWQCHDSHGKAMEMQWHAMPYHGNAKGPGSWRTKMVHGGIIMACHNIAIAKCRGNTP